MQIVVNKVPFTLMTLLVNAQAEFKEASIFIRQKISHWVNAGIAE